MPSARFPTQELRVEGGLRWKLTLWKPLPRPQLTIIAQGGYHSFTFAPGPDGTAVVDVPNVAYTYVSLGARLRLHFTEWASLWAQFVYHVVTNAGTIQDHDNYGSAYTYGIRLSGGLDFLVWRGLKVGATGFYERFQSRFGYDRTATRIADGAVDEYYGATLLVGYVF